MPTFANESAYDAESHVITWSEAVRSVGRSAVACRLRQRAWQQPLPGVIVMHGGPLTEADRAWAALRYCGEGAALTGLTALRFDGYKGREPATVYVRVVSTRHPQRQKGLVVRRTRERIIEDLHPSRTPPRVRPGRAVVDAAALAGSDRAAVGIVLGSVQQGLVEPQSIIEVATAMTKSKRRGIVLGVAGDAQGGTHSLPEREALEAIMRAGLPLPSRQSVRVVGGKRRYLDLEWRRYRVGAEIDGAPHMDVEQWWADNERLNELIISGNTTLRFPSWVVRIAEYRFVDQVGRALRVAGWNGVRVRHRPAA